MLRLIVSTEGAVVRELALDRDRISLGRRPYNDVVLAQRTVSGEHAAFLRIGGQVFVEDLNSTNGTCVNGKPVRRQQVFNGDTIEIGAYTIRFVDEPEVPGPPTPVRAAAQPLIRVLAGGSVGRELLLDKAVTTVGKPGVVVAAVTRSGQGFAIHQLAGSVQATLNGTPIGTQARALKDGDLIALAGTIMKFVQPSEDR